MSEPIITAIYGGTFNPLHTGHLAVAQSVIESGLADELWLMVTPQNPWKQGNVLLDDSLRLRMAQEAVADMPGIVASDFEFSLPKPSYTANTMRALVKAYPDREFMLVMGADNWTKFADWRDNEYLLENFSMAVYPRDGYPLPDDMPDHVYILDCPLVDISSSELRQMIQEGQSIDKWVPATVARTISELGIYKD